MVMSRPRGSRGDWGRVHIQSYHQLWPRWVTGPAHASLPAHCVEGRVAVHCQNMLRVMVGIAVIVHGHVIGVMR